MSKARVAVIQGGPSSEASVSRTSAAGVAAALRSEGYEATLFELDAALSGHLADARFDAVFPVVHGALGEDGALQGLLEILALPYVGSGVLASATAADKVQAKRLFRAAGLPIAEEMCVRRGGDFSAAATLVRRTIGDAIVVKPATQGSAIGVTRVPANEPIAALVAALEGAAIYDDVILCERFVIGREVTCGVTDVPSLGGLHALPPTEIRAKNADFYDFRSRYAAGESEHVCPARLSEKAFAEVQAVARAAHELLGCRDLSRADFVVGDGDDGDAVTLLEVNTMPGMTATSLYPEAMGVSGVAFSTMCAAFVEAALQRQTRRVVPVPPMP